MRSLILPLAAALALGGCAAIPNPNVATPNQVVIAVNAYNAAVATGRNYLVLPLCMPNLILPCRTPGMSQKVYTALKAARPARNQLLAALKANQAAPITAIQALEAAYSVVQSLPKQ